MNFRVASKGHIDIYYTFRLFHAIHSELDQTCLSGSVLSDNKGIEATFRRWCNKLPYYIDKDFAGDDIFNTFPKL